MRNKYFLQRDNTFYTKMTKNEIRASINMADPTSFLPILKDMNYPYWEDRWMNFLTRYGPEANIIGKYISLMRLKSYQGYTWTDTPLIAAYQEKKENEKRLHEKMYQVIDVRGSGKTGRLMLLAKENNGVLVCSNPNAMASKARAYGLTGFDIISYSDYFNHNYEYGKMVFIDELDTCVKSLGNILNGYSLTIGD